MESEPEHARKEIQLMVGGRIIYEGEFDLEKILSCVNEYVKWYFDHVFWRGKVRILVKFKMDHRHIDIDFSKLKKR